MGRVRESEREKESKRACFRYQLWQFSVTSGRTSRVPSQLSLSNAHTRTHSYPPHPSLSLSNTDILMYTITYRGLGLYHFYWFSVQFFAIRELGVFDICWRCKTNANRKTFSALNIAYPVFSSFTWLLFISKLFSPPSVSLPPSHSSFWHHCSFALSQCIFQSLGTLQIQHVKWAGPEGAVCLKRQTGTESVCQIWATVSH